MHGAGAGVGGHYSRKKEQQRWAEWQKIKNDEQKGLQGPAVRRSCRALCFKCLKFILSTKGSHQSPSIRAGRSDLYFKETAMTWDGEWIQDSKTEGSQTARRRLR